MFVMRVIAKNSTDLVVTDLVDNMWKLYKEKEEKSNPSVAEEAVVATSSDKEREALTADQ